MPAETKKKLSQPPRHQVSGMDVYSWRRPHAGITRVDKPDVLVEITPVGIDSNAASKNAVIEMMSGVDSQINQIRRQIAAVRQF